MRKWLERKSLRKILQQLHLVCYMLKEMNIHAAYISKHNLNYEKQIIVLMISNGESIELSCSKKHIYIKRSNVKTQC